MRVCHFYHAYAAGEGWRDAFAEHLAALEDSGYDGPFHVGVVGSPEQRAEALAELHWLRPPDEVFEADEGWEQVTLHKVHDYAKQHKTSAIMYAHTKGAHNPVDINIRWRQSMTWHVILGWRDCVKAVSNRGYDAVGCHWLTPQEFPNNVTSPFFGGTYWVASAKYLSRLSPCAEGSRWDAEMWIGLGNPKALDLNPGWPGTNGNLQYRPMRRLIATSA